MPKVKPALYRFYITAINGELNFTYSLNWYSIYSIYQHLQVQKAVEDAFV